jgi:hypothetical protein
MRRLIHPLLRMTKTDLQRSFQHSTLTLGKGEVMSSILITGLRWKYWYKGVSAFCWDALLL